MGSKLDNLKALFGRRRGEKDRDDEVERAANLRDLFERLQTFGTLDVGDVMVPRVDIHALEVSWDYRRVLKEVGAHTHTRYPVYRGSPDYVLGCVHVSDLLRPDLPEDLNLRDVLRKVLVTVKERPAVHLLMEMSQLNRRMATVVDEYGGLEGLVTVGDLNAAIIDRMEAEKLNTAFEVDDHRTSNGGMLTVSARIPVEDLEALMDVKLNAERVDADDPPDTLGGLISGLIERVPARGEIIEDPGAPLEYRIVEADPRRIYRVAIINRK